MYTDSVVNQPCVSLRDGGTEICIPVLRVIFVWITKSWEQSFSFTEPKHLETILIPVRKQIDKQAVAC